MKRIACLTLSVLALAFVSTTLSGCEREIASTKETTIKDDGTVKTEEKSVTKDADGDTTITEKETTRKPGDPN